ncbi:hypothetical protein ACWD5B_07425 [Streptomyces tanashiensis]
MEQNTNLPEHAYDLDHDVVFTRRDGSYYPDPDLRPDKEWIVRLQEAGVLPLPGAMQPLNGIPVPSELRLVALGADVNAVRAAHDDRLGAGGGVGGGGVGGGGGGGQIGFGVIGSAIWDGIKAVVKGLGGDGKPPKLDPHKPVGWR